MLSFQNLGVWKPLLHFCNNFWKFLYKLKDRFKIFYSKKKFFCVEFELNKDTKILKQISKK